MFARNAWVFNFCTFYDFFALLDRRDSSVDALCSSSKHFAFIPGIRHTVTTPSCPAHQPINFYRVETWGTRFREIKNETKIKRPPVARLCRHQPLTLSTDRSAYIMRLIVKDRLRSSVEAKAKMVFA